MAENNSIHHIERAKCTSKSSLFSCQNFSTGKMNKVNFKNSVKRRVEISQIVFFYHGDKMQYIIRCVNALCWSSVGGYFRPLHLMLLKGCCTSRLKSHLIYFTALSIVAFPPAAFSSLMLYFIRMFCRRWQNSVGWHSSIPYAVFF